MSNQRADTQNIDFHWENSSVCKHDTVEWLRKSSADGLRVCVVMTTRGSIVCQEDLVSVCVGDEQQINRKM